MKALGMLGGGYGADDAYRKRSRRYRAYWDPVIQAYVTADLMDPNGRYSYYWGRCGDLAVQATLRRFLKPGDTFIDVGANLGMHSLYASRLVGETGWVISFEPHPDAFRLLRAHLGMNRVRQCELHNVALGQEPGEAVLQQVDGHHLGTSTMRGAGGGRSIGVNVLRGDDLLADRQFQGDVLMKIDVEGFEYNVLRGLRQTLKRIRAAFVEVTPEWLASEGRNASDLYREMTDLGFKIYLPEMEWKLKLFAPSLRLTPLTSPPASQHDALFVREGAAAAGLPTAE